MKVWVLDHGCRYEGGDIDAVYTTEASGLKAAETYMAKRIAQTVEFSDIDSPCLTEFEKRPNELGHHYWIEHYKWAYKNPDGSFDWSDGDGSYLKLAWYELQ